MGYNTYFPTQYPVNSITAVNCFLVDPAMFDDIMVNDMLKPKPWKKQSQRATRRPHYIFENNVNVVLVMTGWKRYERFYVEG